MKLRTNFCLTFSLFLLFVLLIQNAFPQEELVPIRAITEPSQNINRLDFSPNGQTLAGCGADDIWLWNPHNGTLLKTFSGHTGWIESIMFSPDGRYLASGGEDTTVRVWDANTGQQLRTLTGHTAHVLSVVFSPDGRYLASGGKDTTVRVWDANTGQQLRTLTGHTSGVTAVVFSPDGQLLVSGEDAMIRVWDADTGQQIGSVLAEHTAPIRSIVFSPDGQLIASASEDSTLRLWNPWTGEALRTLRGHTGPIYAVAFSPDGGLIVSGGGKLGGSSADNTLRLWDPQTGELLKTLTEHNNDLEGLAFNPIALRQNEYMLASGDDSGTVILWRLTSTPEPLTFTPSTVADQTFEVGTPINLTLPIATGGTEPYTYSLDPIPAGLQFDTATQRLSGTPTTVGTTAATYTATDTTGSTASLNFTITVQNTPSLTDLYMYWAEWQGGRIRSATLDGTNRQDLVTGLRTPSDMALDLAGGKMYWTASTALGWTKTQRANLDGTGVEDFTDVGGDGIALDLTSRKMYLVGGSKIVRANLDGTGVEDLVTTGLSYADDMALDLADGKMYWTNRGMSKIQRANLDGSNIQDLVTTGLIGPSGIALDLVDKKMYWTDENLSKIQRANLDGTNVEDLVTTGLGSTEDIELDVASGKMYWTDWGTGKIQRANLDGSNVEDLVTTGLRGPVGIALGIPQTSPGDGLRFTPNTVADQTFEVGTAVSLTLPVATGGTEPYIYTLAPIPEGLDFESDTRQLGGIPTSVGTTNVTYTATDTTGESATLNFTITVLEEGVAEDPLDVDRDGQITVVDLAIVALFYGTQVPAGMSLPADVNADGSVDILDLTLVAQAIDAAGGNGFSLADIAAALEAVAAAPNAVSGGNFAYRNVAAALADAKIEKGIPETVLKALQQLLTEMERAEIPESTALLPNYPNPFNPETWIPYHLAQAANVTLTVYDVRGSVVRELRLGHQPAGVYVNRGRAAYWDGKNQLGEKVASGVYFYTLAAGEFTATRKLLIEK